MCLAIGVPDLQLDRESVELCFRERIGAVRIDRVLRGNHEERFSQSVRNGIDRDLTLRHRFQQSALRSRCRPVEFIRQQHLPNVKVIDISDLDLVENRADYLSVVHQILDD